MGRLDRQNNNFLGQLTAFRNGRRTEAREKHAIISSFNKSTSKSVVQPEATAVDGNRQGSRFGIAKDLETREKRHKKNNLTQKTNRNKSSLTFFPQICNPNLADSV